MGKLNEPFPPDLIISTLDEMSVVEKVTLVGVAFGLWPSQSILDLGVLLKRDPSWPFIRPMFVRVRNSPPGWWKGHERDIDRLMDVDHPRIGDGLHATETR